MNDDNGLRKYLFYVTYCIMTLTIIKGCDII